MGTTYATLCSGIEGFGAGFDAAGMECVFQCEQDKDCNRVLARHYPNVSRTTDVNDARTESELVRLRPTWLAAGFPCQDLSVAGRRAGLAGKRSGLFFRIADLIGACRPAGICLENVPGLLSSNGGRDMGTVLGTLADLGYGLAYRVLDAQWFGVAQRRRRVFIIGCLGDYRRAAEILFERESLPWDSAPSREAGARTTNAITRRLGSGGPDDNRAQGGHLVPIQSVNRGFKGQNGDGIGSSGDPMYSLTVGDIHGVAHTLRAEGFDASEHGTGRGTPLVPVAFAFSSKDDGRDAGAIAPTLRSMNYAESHMNGGGQVAVAFNTKESGRDASVEIAPTLRAESGDPHMGGRSAVASVRQGVRRLTPRECERLQGFEDDWTRYADDGSELSDSSRYRMLGNAVCRNVGEWIGRRITTNQRT